MSSQQLLRSSAASVALLLALSCSDDPAGPNLRIAGIRVLAGGGPDTVTARPVQALIIEARGEGGALAGGKVVRFSTIFPPFSPSAPPPAVAFISSLSSNFFSNFVSDTADQNGQSAVLLSFGTVAGEARIEVTVPEIGLADTITITVQPGAPAHARFSVRDTVLLIDSSFVLSAPLVDRFNNPRTELATLSNLTPTLCSLTGSQVKGTVMGGCMIEAQHGNMRDTARATVLPFGRLAVVTGGSFRLASINGAAVKNLFSITDFILSPGWAPDGSAIVMYEGDPTSTARLSIVDTNGVKLKTVGQNADMLVASVGRFSPDGQWVYFTGRAASPDPFLIWRMKPDGSQRTAITTPETMGVPFRVDASPDGVTIAYDVADQIILANVNTQEKTPTGVQGVAPSFSPDGQTIAFFGPSGSGLRLMDANGTNVRTLLPGGFLEWQPPQWTMDGQWLLVSGPRFVKVSDGTVITVPTLSSYSQVALKPPLGQ